MVIGVVVQAVQLMPERSEILAVLPVKDIDNETFELGREGGPRLDLIDLPYDII